ncbi:hypothetical protein PHSC3_001135 [Chlamydiales bacterium STE3]|nr:hypothetical protein PHSC3_001135 [Chlamydiales bacterium STE3]
MLPSDWIATRITAQATFKFFEEADSDKPGLSTIYAKVSTESDPVPVKLPHMKNIPNLAYLSSAVKVERLLQNLHWQPVYHPQSNTVEFKAFSPENKEWNLTTEIPLRPGIKWVPQVNRTISYACVNTVTTWEWATNKRKVISYPNPISALAENSEGVLIIGDEKGQLHILDKTFSTHHEKAITKIVPCHNSACLIEYEDHLVKVVNVKTEKIEEIGTDQEFLVSNDGLIVCLNKATGTVRRYEYNAEEQKLKEIGEELTKIEKICEVASGGVILLSSMVYEKPSVVDYIFLSKEGIVKESMLLRLKQVIVSSPSRWLNSHTVLYSFIQKDSTRLFRWRDLREQPKDPPLLRDTIDCMLPLSDGSVLCVPTGKPQSLSIVTPEGKLVFTYTLMNKEKITSLAELVDGSLAIRTENFLSILTPRVKLKEVENYKFDKLKLELKYDPDNLQVYDQLALAYESLPLPDDKKSEEMYEMYLGALEKAIQLQNFYQARRFYEKARKIKPKNETSGRVFLSHLKRSLDKKIYKRVLLDLFTLDTQESDLKEIEDEVHELKEKKCKERLFIGEGDFSFTEAFINKHKITHPNLAQYITATELREPQNEVTKQRVFRLQEQGVAIRFGIDAEWLHKEFENRRFKRIQWNCPYGESSQVAEVFRTVIPKFFSSCAQLQIIGDRIHITLMQKSGDYWKVRQSQNPIVLGATQAGYRLIRKRKLGPERYPGYKHTQTDTNKLFTAGTGEEQEFVFEKAGNAPPSPSLEEALKLKASDKKEYQVNTDATQASSLDQYYFECSTDEDSSDGYDSD